MSMKKIIQLGLAAILAFSGASMFQACTSAIAVNPVPFIYVTSNKNAKVQNGVLADVAPSILHIMGLQQPKEMTGKCIIDD